MTPDLRFANYQRLTVRQKKRWLEILLSFEFKNSYDVHDEQGRASLAVKEQGSGLLSFLKRMFLGPLRPFRVHVDDVESGLTVLALERRFRFVFHRLEVFSIDGKFLGAVQKKWSWFRRIYHIESNEGRPLAELFGPIFKPWTFEIRLGERVVGVIQKRWSGLSKEFFTDADNFGIELTDVTDSRLKLLAFAAVVLIDVVHFEKAKG
ncbi:MAG: phospholipid scramblase-related protein [Polyangiales bacterium]